jgi:hypothetical protein
MSQDIAVANKGLQEIVISSMKLGKKEVISEERVSSWLEDMASGKYALSSVIPADAPQKYQGKALYSGTTAASFESLVQDTGLGAGFGAMFGMVGSMPALYALDLSGSAAIFTTFGTMIVGAGLLGFSWHGFPRASQKRHRVLWSKVMAVQHKGIHAWLNARYGIQVSDDMAEKLASQVLTEPYIVGSGFQDVNGQLWVLRFDESVKGFLVEPKAVEVKEVEAPAGIRQAPVILSVGAGHLDGDAGMLGKHIDLRLAQLSRFALTIEESHGVARAVEDAREAVAGFERLELLGAGKNGLDRLTGILGLLDGELDAILRAKIAEEDEALLARQRSVEARQKSKKVVGV